MLAEVSDLTVTDDMHARKRRMFDEADSFVALPGGIGTLEEIVEMMTWAQLRQHRKPVLLAGATTGLFVAPVLVSPRPNRDQAPNATRTSAAATAPAVAQRSHGAGIGRPYTSEAACRMKAAPTRCSSRVNAPSRARSLTTLITRGMPLLSRWTSRSAPGVKASAVAPATRMRCLT